MSSHDTPSSPPGENSDPFAVPECPAKGFADTFRKALALLAEEQAANILAANDESSPPTNGDALLKLVLAQVDKTKD